METSPVWFITGASSGFGRAFAEYALTQGYRVVATARKSESIQPLADQYPNRTLALRMDVNDRSQIDAAVGQAMERFGQVDVLINNAGYGIVGAVEETPEDELRALMETNFFGAMAVTRALLPHLRHRGRGAIVNISSLGGQLSIAGFGSYSASKFALEGISEALAQEVKPLGIKVLIVEPGQFRTNLAGVGMRFMPEIEAYSESAGPTRQFARSSHGTQFGDPYKAARAIDVALGDPNPPLRLQLGQDSVDMIRAHAETLLSDLKRWEAIAVDTRLDG
ncbi:SDR family NAD(P)-dependent oxidoreductase [Acidobacteria bacterium AB60]|nr:SDR family NAD(P)-dependent oxidoreductase [Acidobacteria bacterium AB60]